MFLSIKEIIVVANRSELNEQFRNINTESLMNSGLIVPCKHLDHTQFYENDKLFEILNANQEFTNQIITARCVDWRIQYVDDIIKINEMYPHLVSHVYDLFYCSRSGSIAKNIEIDLIDELHLIEPRVKDITIRHTLSPYELKLVSVLLCSRRTKFNLRKIILYFKFLSECLSTLSLCADCTELESVEFEYSEVDIDKENEFVINSVQEFKEKFGFIKKLTINHKKV